MQTEFLKLFIAIVLFSSFSFTVFSQDTVYFEKITQALADETIDRDAVIKLVITGEIEGTDYSENSHWSKFKNLNETFPNIHSVEILTDQDIPIWTAIENEFGQLDAYFLFYWQVFHNPYYLTEYSSLWLKHFSAPNVKKIPEGTFNGCKNLISVNIKSAIEIGRAVFQLCESLSSINLPVVQRLGSSVFNGCFNLGLYPIKFGTGFTETTTISFNFTMFGSWQYEVATDNIVLILGENVLPAPNLYTNVWQDNSGYGVGKPYVWKNIKIKYVDIDEEKPDEEKIYCISPNIYYICNSSDVELYDLTGRLLRIYSGENIIDLNDLAKGFYFLRFFVDGEYTVVKIVVN